MADKSIDWGAFEDEGWADYPVHEYENPGYFKALLNASAAECASREQHIVTVTLATGSTFDVDLYSPKRNAEDRLGPVKGQERTEFFNK